MASTWRSALALLILDTLIATCTNAQNCYYPNSDISTTDGACNADGWDTCCPLNWQCLSNGLCRLPSENYYGRYTCTDQAWATNSCPQYCTQNGTAPGDEAILLCSDGSWCCDGDRSFDCCEKDDAVHFSLADKGTVIASITALQSPTSVPSTPTDEPDSTSTTSTTTSSSTSSTASISLSTSAPTTTFLSTSSGPEGQASTITIVSIASSSGNATASQPADSDSSDSSLTIALAVGIPVAALLPLGALIFLLWKRKRRQQTAPMASTYDYTDGDLKYATGHFPPEGHAPELDSYPVAPVRRKSGHPSELMGSSVVSSPSPRGSPQTQPYAQEHDSPHRSVVSAASGMASPSPYAPSPVTPPVPVGAPFTSNLRVVNEEPLELWGGYVPYRPPGGQVASIPAPTTPEKGPEGPEESQQDAKKRRATYA